MLFTKWTRRPLLQLSLNLYAILYVVVLRVYNHQLGLSPIPALQLIATLHTHTLHTLHTHCIHYTHNTYTHYTHIHTTHIHTHYIHTRAHDTNDTHTHTHSHTLTHTHIRYTHDTNTHNTQAPCMRPHQNLASFAIHNDLEWDESLCCVRLCWKKVPTVVVLLVLLF